ncbi:MAG: putative N-acetylmannosamine-6-phosphate 2-epimerase [Oscillatoria sp. SIO1A7]|nr:putative N-acetylmannosamine-6-phosphate 2-epimerase [Oscillatoria sp. SIO1A7]
MNEKICRGLIVSCQAPPDSPLYAPEVIAAMAGAAIARGAVGLRIDTPAHVAAVRELVGAEVPIIGLWKVALEDYSVYITPEFEQAAAIAAAGADIIAIDATQRNRPEPVATLIERIHNELAKPVMADIDTIEAAIAAANAGADVVGTTLYGYTRETESQSPPGFDLLAEMVGKLSVPAICEGGIASPAMATKALQLGAIAVVVGTDITGIDKKVEAYQKAILDTIAGSAAK